MDTVLSAAADAALDVAMILIMLSFAWRGVSSMAKRDRDRAGERDRAALLFIDEKESRCKAGLVFMAVVSAGAYVLLAVAAAVTPAAPF